MKNKSKIVFYYNSKPLQVASAKLYSSIIVYKDVSILPVSAIVTCESLKEYLHPKELISNNNEFLRSRYLLRFWWKQHNIPWPLIKQSLSHPYPKWPHGLCGSLTHKRGHVGVCLNQSKFIHAYGPKKKVLIMPTDLTIKLIKKTAKLKVKKVSNIKNY